MSVDVRTKGSCRFETYHKVQWFDERSLTWRDVHRAYATVAEAQAAFVPGKRCRVMVITETGRSPLPEAVR
jgi:hypothetical protein